MKPRRWTKREIKQLCSALDSFLLCNRPIESMSMANQPRREAFNAWLDKALGEHRVEVVVAEVRSLRNLFARRADESRKTAEHYRTHPELYGEPSKMIWDGDRRTYISRDAAIAQVVDRFNGYAAEEDKAVQISDRLIARIETEGLPPEVLSYDPRTPRT